jgi:hypothetical protein
VLENRDPEIADIYKITAQISEGVRQIVRAIRKELVRSRAEVYRIKKGAGVMVLPQEKAEHEEDLKELGVTDGDLGSNNSDN